MDELNYEITSFDDLPILSTNARMKDDLSMFGHATRTDLPMWVGFHGQHHVDKLAKQVVYYMPNMNKPITRPEVVAETMRIAMNCAKEMGQMYGIVIYCLDVAKIAQRIQSTDADTENPEFGELFIMLGVFHIYICHFRALGKLIAESGGPALLVDSGVIAFGSLRGFLDCHAYNRCKRVHPLFGLALEIHFRRFLKDYENQDIAHLVTAKDFGKGEVENVLNSSAFEELFKPYAEFSKGTEDGQHGLRLKEI